MLVKEVSQFREMKSAAIKATQAGVSTSTSTRNQQRITQPDFPVEKYRKRRNLPDGSIPTKIRIESTPATEIYPDATGDEAMRAQTPPSHPRYHSYSAVNIVVLADDTNNKQRRWCTCTSIHCWYALREESRDEEEKFVWSKDISNTRDDWQSWRTNAKVVYFLCY